MNKKNLATEVATGKRKLKPSEIAAIRGELLRWYRQTKRELPWRGAEDAYAIWVSEIMLQQTRAAVVAEHYPVFLKRFPTVEVLAAAEEQDVLARWSGLGYYNRARNLWKGARYVVNELDGKIPTTAVDLRKLPGIGAYTSAAIASIAHGEAVAVVDGNVERVVARLVGMAVDKSTQTRKEIELIAGQLLDVRAPGDFNQAMMEMGATMCVPRTPLCRMCPLVTHCATRGEHETVARAAMREQAVSFALATRMRYEPQKAGTRKAAGELTREVLLVRRKADEGVMAGMWELPTLKLRRVPPAELRMTLSHAIMQTNYKVSIRTVIEPDVERLILPTGSEERWVRVDESGELALTGLARKVLKRAKLIDGGSEE